MKFFRQLLLGLAILIVSVRPGIAQSAPPAPPVANAATFTVAEATKEKPTTVTGILTATDSNTPPKNLTFRLGTPPSHGKVTVDSGGNFTYTPDLEYVGFDSFGFIANNGSFDSAEATVFVGMTYVEEPPTANPVAAAIPPNQTLYGQLQGYDEADNALTYTKASDPTHGTVTVDSQGGHFTYVPNKNFTGVDSFTYKVNDGTLDSDPATVSIVVGADSVGFIADTMIPRVTGANLLNVPVYSQPSVSGPAVDEAVDRANQRLYVLTAKALNVYDVTTTTDPNTNLTTTTGGITPDTIASVSLNFTAEHIALSLDGRTAYIGSKGKVTAINLYPENVVSEYKAAYSYIRDYNFPDNVPKGRDVAAMGVHPAGDRLYVVIDRDPKSKSLDINNNLLISDLGHGTTAAQAVAPLTDYGYLTYLDISADLRISAASQTAAKFVTPFNLKNLSPGVAVLDIRHIAFSPDGNYALICGVGAQHPRVTPFGVMPTSDVGTGGMLVVDVRRYTDQKISTPPAELANPYLGFIPDTEYGEDTAALRLQIVQKGATIVHWDVRLAGGLASVASGLVDVSLYTGVSDIPGIVDSQIATLNATTAAYDLLWKSYRDYGNMQAYFDLYPRNMVGASGVAINHTGDFGVVTMQDTNNLGLLKLSLSKQNLSGYSPGSPLVDDAGKPLFYIARGTGKTVNGFDAANSAQAPKPSVDEWAFPQTVGFTSDDSRIFIGMANGIAKPDKTNQAGTADAFYLKTQRDDKNSIFLSSTHPSGYGLAGNGGSQSPRLATTLQSFDSSHDFLSDQLKAYNRWNSLRPLSQIDPQNLSSKDSSDPAHLTVAQCLAKIASTDLNHLTIPGKPLPADPNLPDSLNVGYFLPLSGVGYRLDTYGLPADTTNFANRTVVTALEQMGVEWNRRYHDSDRGIKDPYPISRPYYIVGLMSQPGGGAIQNQAGEPLQYASADASEVDLPYFKLNSDGTFSDEAFNFVPSAGPNSPADNTGETKDGFDEPNTEALIRLLLAQSQVTKIELDPYALELIKAAAPDIVPDARFFPHGLHFDDPKITNTSRRDMSNHMHVTFSYVHVDLSINPIVFTTIDNEFLTDSQSDYLNDLLQLNFRDTDRDGVPDYASGYDLSPNGSKPNACPPFTPMTIRFPDGLDLTKLQFTLTYDESDPTQVTTTTVSPVSPSTTPTTEYVLPAGTYRIWTKDGPQARREAEITAGDFIASGKPYLIENLLTISASNNPPGSPNYAQGSNNRTATVYIESVYQGKPPTVNDVTINLVGAPTPDPGPPPPVAPSSNNIASWADNLNVGPGLLAVDADHDGRITLPSENKSDVVSVDKPYQFWINDDFDSAGPTPSTTRNYADNVVNGANDLKDFYPVFLDLKKLVAAHPPSSSVIYKLKQEEGALNFVYTNLTRVAAFQYVRGKLTKGFGPGLVQPAASATTQQITTAGVDLFGGSPAFLDALKNKDGGVLLIEGRQLTDKPLVLSAENSDGTIIATIKLELCAMHLGKLWETSNKANQIFNPTKKDDDNDNPDNTAAQEKVGDITYGVPRNNLYVVADPNDNKLKVSLDLGIPAALRAKFLVGAWDGATKVATADGGKDAAFTADVSQPVNLQIAASEIAETKEYQIRIGLDANGNGILDDSEAAVPIEIYRRKDTGKLGFATVKGISNAKYKTHQDTIVGKIHFPFGLQSKPGSPAIHARSFLALFYYNGDFSQIKSTIQPDMETGRQQIDAFANGKEFAEWLTHNSGATFTDVGVATINDYQWSATSEVAEFFALRTPFALQETVSHTPAAGQSVTGTTLQAFYNAQVKTQAEQALKNSLVGTSLTFPLDRGWYDAASMGLFKSISPGNWVEGLTINVGKDDGYGGYGALLSQSIAGTGDFDDFDAFGTIGRGRLLNPRYRITVTKQDTGIFTKDIKYRVSAVEFACDLEDLYDFNYEASGLASNAAALQIGFGNGANGSDRAQGNIFRHRIRIDHNYLYPFDLSTIIDPVP